MSYACSCFLELGKSRSRSSGLVLKFPIFNAFLSYLDVLSVQSRLLSSGFVILKFVPFLFEYRIVRSVYACIREK